MLEQTIVAVYDTTTQAEAAAASLRSEGISEGAISLHTEATRAAAPAPVHERGFWAGLLGGEPDHDTAVYDRSLQSGGTVLTVKVGEAHIDRVMDILESHSPADIEEHTATGGVAQTADIGTGDTLRLAEEQLAVGKRVVNRGSTRIRRYVVETPVEQTVALRSERVTLERRPVTDAQVSADSFTDKSIELVETDEEAVISKTAHVYEEVGLRKEATERVETVRDTVRKEEVEVEQIPGRTNTAASRV